ncbi:hypothetical protein TNCV_3019911 [Trichonephila clavipes]|nr:hypothetical protein TNCV_3019911 [Trichonephila clavipes]
MNIELAVQNATKSTEQQVEELIRAVRRVTIDIITMAIGCYHGLAYGIMHARLNFRKVCTCSVPWQLTETHKKESNGHLLSSVW